jgi:hypothetical protein
MSTVQSLRRCMICGGYLTTDEEYIGYRCVDPGHWQAAGLLAPRDFYAMARLVAGARAELIGQPDNRTVSVTQV